ncbi:MAG: class I fructose-bisphosphate aldolase [Bacteroidia bacterium]
MNKQLLKDTIMQLFTNNKGLLAMDESTGTCNKRFAAAGIPQTVEMRRSYRELIITTPGLNESIGGAILYDETIRQQTKEGIPFADKLIQAGIIPGIKVDTGAKPMAGFPNEKVTEGLDGLRERLSEYKTMGARFAKWRAVITIGDGIPTKAYIEANVHALARYAALCQEADIVPIVEPEVLMEGNHSIQHCYEVTEQVLKILFYQLYIYKIDLEGMILKPNMIIAGTNAVKKNSVDEVAEATVNCLLASVPAAMPVIAFLSGGQSPEEAAAHLNAINKNFKNRLPWIVSFSFARAIQQPALELWKGKEDNIEEAQKLLYNRAKLGAAARAGIVDGELTYEENKIKSESSLTGIKAQ